jgi:hypothetical protein
MLIGADVSGPALIRADLERGDFNRETRAGDLCAAANRMTIAADRQRRGDTG